MSVIAVNFLNCWRFGNRMSVYAFARAYAEKHGCQLQTSPWIGQQIFNLNDPPIEQWMPSRSAEDLEKWDGETHITIVGYAQHQKHLLYSRAQARQWFSFRPFITDLMHGVPHLEIAAHVRWGDFTTTPGFIIISKESYLAACDRFGIDKHKLAFISEENPLTVEGLNPEFSLLPDFWTLVHADILLRGPSTFSWWAGVLGDHQRIFSPDQRGITIGTGQPQLVPFVEGNHMPITSWWEGHSELHLREQ